MIYGSLEDLNLYCGIYRSLDVLIDWLSEHDLTDLQMGRNVILGDKVYANVMAPVTRSVGEAHYETHRRYHDLQLDLEGREAFKVAFGKTIEIGPFNEEDDFELVDAQHGIDGDLDEGRFAIFVAGEPHMPTLQFGSDGPCQVKKVCFKLIADEFFDD